MIIEIGKTSKYGWKIRKMKGDNIILIEIKIFKIIIAISPDLNFRYR